VEGLKASIEEKRHAALAANMLGVPTEALIELLTLRRTTIRDQEIVIKLQKDEATFRRDAVAKALYASAFEWIVKCANDHLGFQEGETMPFIGVLDIFGFESFAVNGLEQVLINFANEYLQNVFNKQVRREIRSIFVHFLCSLVLFDYDKSLHPERFGQHFLNIFLYMCNPPPSLLLS
jgi:myosin heavy subunit